MAIKSKNFKPELSSFLKLRKLTLKNFLTSKYKGTLEECLAQAEKDFVVSLSLKEELTTEEVLFVNETPAEEEQLSAEETPEEKVVLLVKQRGRRKLEEIENKEEKIEETP